MFASCCVCEWFFHTKYTKYPKPMCLLLGKASAKGIFKELSSYVPTLR